MSDAASAVIVNANIYNDIRDRVIPQVLFPPDLANDKLKDTFRYSSWQL